MRKFLIRRHTGCLVLIRDSYVKHVNLNPKRSNFDSELRQTSRSTTFPQHSNFQMADSTWPNWQLAPRPPRLLRGSAPFIFHLIRFFRPRYQFSIFISFPSLNSSQDILVRSDWTMKVNQAFNSYLILGSERRRASNRFLLKNAGAQRRVPFCPLTSSSSLRHAKRFMTSGISCRADSLRLAIESFQQFLHRALASWNIFRGHSTAIEEFFLHLHKLIK